MNAVDGGRAGIARALVLAAAAGAFAALAPSARAADAAAAPASPVATDAAAAAPGARESVIAPLAARSLLLDVVAVPGAAGRLVAVGERGHVLVSTDGGGTWTQSRAPTRATLTAVWFVDARHGWAVGHDEVILRTEDGGVSWTRTHFEPDREQPLLDVWFADAQQGLAVGAFATIYRSTDGGRSWTAVPFSPAPAAGPRATPAAPADDSDAMLEDEEVTEPHLNAIVGAGGRLYLAAEAGNLYRSDDGGTTWTPLPSPYEGSFFGLLPVEDDALLAFGLRGHVFRSEDAGATWARIDAGTEALLAGATRLADGTVVIAGLAGTVLASRDGGRSFVRLQEADRRGFAAVAPGRNGPVLVGEAGVREIAAARLLEAAKR